MKKTQYICDICSKAEADKKDQKVMVLFTTEQNEGRPKSPPSISFENIDFCKSCYNKLVNGHRTIMAAGAMGHNTYWFSKKATNANDERRLYMRKRALTVEELVKGYTSEPTDNAMKTALEMTKYVLELTNDIDGHDLLK